MPGDHGRAGERGEVSSGREASGTESESECPDTQMSSTGRMTTVKVGTRLGSSRLFYHGKVECRLELPFSGSLVGGWSCRRLFS